MENKKYNWYRIDFIILNHYEETISKTALIQAESDIYAEFYLKHQLRKQRVVLWSIVSTKVVDFK